MLNDKLETRKVEKNGGLVKVPNDCEKLDGWISRVTTSPFRVRKRVEAKSPRRRGTLY